MENMEFGNELDKLAYKYGTDKCPQLKHDYTTYYYEMFKDRRNEIKKVLEMGIGYYETMKHVEIKYDDKLKRHYHRGASLKMWRDFFPDAQIYGADIMPETMFEDERIKTFLCDETKKGDIENLVKQTGSDIDFFVDDGSHRYPHQIFLAKTILPLLKDDVIYIIEDTEFTRKISSALSDYDCEVVGFSPKKFRNNKLVVVRKK